MRSSSLVLSASILGLCFTAACGGTGTGTAGSGSGTGAGGAPTGSGGHGGGVGGQTSAVTGSGGDATAASTAGVGGASTATAGTGGSGGMACPAGTIECEGTVQKVCDGNGGFVTTDCGTTQQVCVPALGCLACTPGTGSCNGNLGTYCLGDGTGFATEGCDPVQGTTCNAQTGHCDGACGSKALGKSYIGCDYYPTVTANLVATKFHFAVAVSNTTASSATVTITQGANTISTVNVAANSVQVVTLPWQNTLKGPASNNGVPFPSSVKVNQGAYRLRSTQPVVVYQFSPLEYTTGGNCTFDQTACSFSNDASLLLPTNAWTGTYRVAARHHFYTSSGFYAVTASADNTVVTVAAAPGGGGVKAGVAGINTSGNGSVTLNAGDVIEIVTSGNDNNPSNPDDVTGTLVTADKPVQVIGGHQCTYIPDSTGYCDHLEESMFPFESLANDYIVAAPLIPTGGNTPKVEMVRVVATTANTTLTYDPPQGGAPASIAQAGQWIELANNSKDFKISANQPILVAQYMEGQDAGGNSGDPAMALAVATSQFRKSYLFHAPTNYETSYVNIIAPTGTPVNLDGAAVAGFTPIGGTGYSVARKSLSNAGTGNHTADSTDGFGISVYGYGQYTSYWYPGGSDLTVLHQ
jgi:IgGFc binding protein